ncbi:hypothetical protein [Nocardioides sp.]|uniref:hypothetical protein n=1 Tax=Nocardioides sp. TaxID=35761 RepID=UPI002ED0DE36
MSRLSDRTLRRAAWSVWWAFIAVLTSTGLMDLSQDARITVPGVVEGAIFAVVIGTFPLSGLLVVRRQPRNSVGWLLLAVGAVWTVGGIGDVYSTYGLVIEPGSLPLAAVGATVSNAIWAPALGVMSTFLLQRFPDGRLVPGRWWRALSRLSAGVIVTLTALLLVSPGELEEGSLAGQQNPIAIEALEPVGVAILGVLLLCFTLCIVASAWSLIVRFRRSRGVERQQLKWMTTAAAVMALAFFTNILLSVPFAPGTEPEWLQFFNNLAFVTWALLPLSIAAAVLKHGLYDIDVVINRALVYGSLTACLAGVYLTSVLLLQLLLQPLTERSDLAVAASTLAVAALFGPVRRRIQVAVDRRFYRHKYDATRTVADFSARLRQQIDLDAIGRDLVRIADEAVQPTGVSLWLRPAVTVSGRLGPRKDTP